MFKLVVNFYNYKEAGSLDIHLQPYLGRQGLREEAQGYLIIIHNSVTSLQVSGNGSSLAIILQTLDINPGEYVSRKMRLLTQRGERAKSSQTRENRKQLLCCAVRV